MDNLLLNRNEKYIFVFDFDLTLTFKSAHGYDKYSDFIYLFESEENVELLKKIFYKIKEIGGTIYLNTRGFVKNIILILKNMGIEIGNNKLIKDIKGSERIEEINCPFSELEKNKYNITMIDDINILWAIKKVIYLNHIRDIENTQYNNILFFDDSHININIAKMNGYNNSYIIGCNDSGVIGLDYLLIRLTQILELIDKNK